MAIAVAKPPVRMFDYVEADALVRDEILAAIADVVDSGTLILGPQVRGFEQAFARFLNAPGQAVGVGNGTDAVAIALRAVGVGQGDEVITVANTAIPTVSAIRMAGARPVFCDIDPVTLLMDVEDAARHVTERTRAIVPVHLYGGAVDMDAVGQLAARHGLAMVEDCAQSCGTTWRGRMTGTLGDVGCFSFYPTKNLGAYGDAGLCFTRSETLAETMRSLRAYGRGDQYSAEREGVNSRLDEMQAAVLNVKLRRLHEQLAARREVAAWYAELLDPHIARPAVSAEVDASFHLLVILAARRAELVARLREAGIDSAIHYPTPIHCMRAYAFLRRENGGLPHTERAAERVLSLPCYPGLSKAAVRRTARVVNEVLA